MSPRKKYPVLLSAEDREALVRVTTTGVRGASMIRRARVLLALDTAVGEVDPRAVIADRAEVSCETVRPISKRFAETGGDVWATVGRKEREFPPVPSPVTGEAGARLIALACSAPPAGHARWPLRLLEEHVALMGDIPDKADWAQRKTNLCCDGLLAWCANSMPQKNLCQHQHHPCH